MLRDSKREGKRETGGGGGGVIERMIKRERK